MSSVSKTAALKQAPTITNATDKCVQIASFFGNEEKFLLW